MGLDDWARQYNWTYDPRDDNWAYHFGGLPSANGGREAWHILRGGHRDRRVDAFHYFFHRDEYERQRLRRRRTYRYMVVNVLLPREVPTLVVGREMWDSMFDLDLESVEFNKRFKVKVREEDAKFAYDVLHPRMMEHLLADRRATELGWHFRFERGDLYTWEEWPRDLDMAVVMQKADYLIDILELVPDYVWSA